MQWVLVSIAMGAVYFTCAASVNYVLFLPFSESAAAANQCGGCWCQLRWEQFTCAAGVECVLLHAFYLYRKGELLSFSCMFQASCRSDSVRWVLVSIAIGAVYFTCAASVNLLLHHH